MTLEQIQEKVVENLVEKLDELNLELDFSYLFSPLDYDDIEDWDNDDLYDALNGQGMFDAEIIYYHTAMDYLLNNDPSLKESLELAADMGYTCNKLNSETLASILASENIRDDYQDNTNNIDGIFDEMREEYEELKAENKIEE